MKSLALAIAAVSIGIASHAQDKQDTTKKDTAKGTLMLTAFNRTSVASYQDTAKKDTAKKDAQAFSNLAFYQDTTKKDTTKKGSLFLASNNFTLASYQDTASKGKAHKHHKGKKKDSTSSLAMLSFYQDTTKKDTTKKDSLSSTASNLALAFYQDTTKKDTTTKGSLAYNLAFYREATKKDTTKKDSVALRLALNKFNNSNAALIESVSNVAVKSEEYISGKKEAETEI